MSIADRLWTRFPRWTLGPAVVLALCVLALPLGAQQPPPAPEETPQVEPQTETAQAEPTKEQSPADALENQARPVAEEEAEEPDAAPRPACDRVAVLGDTSLTMIDERGFSVLGSVPIPEGMEKWWRTDDGRYLGVVSATGRGRKRTATRLTAIDFDSLEVVGTETLAHNLELAVTSREGRLAYLLFSGKAPKKGVSEPPSLVLVNTVTGRVLAGTDLDGVPMAVVVAREPSLAVLAFAAPNPTAPGRLVFLDALTLESRGELRLPGPLADLFWNDDVSRVYALDVGVDAKKVEKARTGHVYVVDTGEARLIADLDVGAAPGPLSWDEEEGVFYQLTQPRKTRGAEASFLVIEDDRIVRELGLPERPVAVHPSPDRSRFYILHKKGISIVDDSVEQIEGRIALTRAPNQLMFLEPPTKGYLLHPASSVVTQVDLEARRTLGEIVTGRTGKKVGLFFADVGIAVLGQMQSTMLTGNPYALPYVLPIRLKQTNAIASADGKMAYIHNSETDDVTVIDTETNTVALKFAGGSGGLRWVGEGDRFLAAPKWGKLILYDTRSGQPKPPIPFPGWPSYCPSGRHAWSAGDAKTGMMVVDLDTGKVAHRFPAVWGTVVFVESRDSASG